MAIKHRKRCFQLNYMERNVNGNYTEKPFITYQPGKTSVALQYILMRG